MEKLVFEDVRDFDTDQIFDCGQCFRWERQTDGSYIGPALGVVARVSYADLSAPLVEGKKTRPHGTEKITKKKAWETEAESSKVKYAGRLTIEKLAGSRPLLREEWRHYFDLDRDYSRIKARLSSKDDIVSEAIKYGQGIRILNQEKWETLISFIISQNNNIPRIKKCIEKLCAEFGEYIGELPAVSGQSSVASGQGSVASGQESVISGQWTEGSGQESVASGQRSVGSGQSSVASGQWTEASGQSSVASGQESEVSDDGLEEGQRYYAMPTPEVLAALTPEDLAGVRLGYRARYLIETARAVSADKGETLGRTEAMSSTEAYQYLTGLCGVGPKVANCIMLFSMGKCDSFPIDVWVRRVMHRLYGFDENDARGMRSFAAERFGEYGGIAQQYLFYYMRWIVG